MSKLVGKGNYAYEQGFSNEKSEEDARVAFTIFFVSLYGDKYTNIIDAANARSSTRDW